VNTFGVFQTYYEMTLLKSKNASDISWIGTFQAFLLVALALVLGPLFDRGYFRPMIVCGSILTVLGMMMVSLAKQYWQVFLAQALCVGLGSSLLFLPSVALVATYFTTKRALAIGVVASGGSLGSVIFPIVFEQLQPRIGFPWTVRVIAFISLATLAISISTLRPRLPPSRPRNLLDLSAFKNTPWLFFNFGLFLFFIGLYVPIFYIISWAHTHIRLDEQLSFYMLAVLNGASAFGRIIPGLLADRLGGGLELLTASCIIAGILAFAAISIHDLGGLIVFSIFYGFISGAMVSLPPSVIASLVPNLAVMGTWMGMSFCFAALGILIGSPIAGTIIHVEKNEFSGGFIFAGSLALAAAASLCMALMYKSWKTKANGGKE
jgi:MFS family permease